MVQSSKILTVSYGTFSCTLEGFDDAFGTMKAIAEYFRDLAAEDRYFGAEPPQPDADMLAHIAQKEIARRVEAHRDENGFVLRAGEPAVAPVAAVTAAATADAVDELVEAQSPAPEPVAEVGETDAQPVETAGPVIEEVEEPDSAEAEPVVETVAEDADEDVIADVAGLVAEAEVTPIEDEGPAEESGDELSADIAEPSEIDEDGSEGERIDAVAEDDAAEEIAEAAEDEADEIAAQDVAETVGDDADEAEADIAEAVADEVDEAEDVAEAVEDEADEIAADIAEDEVGEIAAEDIAEPVEDEATPDAVAAFFADTTDDSSVYDDDTVEQDMVAPEPIAQDVEEAPARMSAAESIAAKLQRIRAVVSRRGAAATDQEFTEDEHADSTAHSALDAAQDDDSAEAEIIAPPMTADDDDLAGPLDALDSEDAQEDGGDLDEVIAEEALAEPSEDISELEANDTLNAILSDEIEATDASDAEEADAPSEQEIAQAQAQVVKVTREEFDAILAADRDEAEAAEAADVSDSALSDEDEADLLRELAEVEAELIGEEPAADIAADDVEPASGEDESLDDDEIASIFADEDADQHSGLSDDADDDADVTRLLDEAGDKLEDDAASDRRSEFAHLRAAMAAGKAEEAAGGSMSETASDGAYREDLARVVRPRRPEATEPGERTSRPQDEKPAPLKLVAAQRVDAEMAPVQPRRVMSAPIDDVVDESAEGKMKFADYASSLGAVELPDLLEAAASYLSFVEGQEQFSRPQLMTKVRMVEKDDFSREDGLRSFGLLLRDGKIEKTQAGRFTVSDRIGFRPDDTREAG